MSDKRGTRRAPSRNFLAGTGNSFARVSTVDWAVAYRIAVAPITEYQAAGSSARTAPRRREYDHGMKLKTSVTLDRRVVAAVDAIARGGESRSQVIERLLRQSLAARRRSARDERDRGIIDAHADELNEEALDVLGYQVET